MPQPSADSEENVANHVGNNAAPPPSTRVRAPCSWTCGSTSAMLPTRSSSAAWAYTFSRHRNNRRVLSASPLVLRAVPVREWAGGRSFAYVEAVAHPLCLISRAGLPDIKDQADFTSPITAFIRTWDASDRKLGWRILTCFQLHLLSLLEGSPTKKASPREP